MAHPTKQEALAILERRHRVMRLYIQGQPQHEIARAFEVNPVTICRDVAWVRERWLESAKLDNGIRVAQELARTDECERQAWLAWERSQQPAETLRAKKRGEVAETEKTSKGQAGDPRFLDVILKCVARRCAILGLDAPQKLEDVTPSRLVEEVVIVDGRDPAPASDASRAG